MPNIPVEQIPNAPQTGGTISGYVPQYGNSAQHIEGLAGKVMTPSIDADAFSASSKALQGIAQGLQGIGGAAGEIATHIADNVNYLQITNANAVMQKKFGEYQAGLAGASDPATWLKGWQDQLPDVQSAALEGVTSPWAKRHLQADFTKFSADTTTHLLTSGAREVAERSKAAHMQQIQDFISSGQPEKAKEVVADGVAHQVFFPEVGAHLEKHIDDQADVQSVMNSIRNAPAQTVEALKSGNGWPGLDPLVRDNMILQAEKEYSRQHSQVLDTVLSSIDDNSITDPETIRTMLEGKVTEADLGKDTKALKSAFVKMNGPDFGDYTRLRNRIATYDPAADPTQKEWFNIKRAIISQPQGWREQLNDEFAVASGKKGLSGDSRVLSEMSSQIEKMDALGIFGPTGLGKVGGKMGLKDLTEYEASRQKVFQLQNEIREKIKTTPGISLPDAFKWLNERVAEDVTKMPGASDSHFYNPFSWGGKGQQTPLPPTSSPVLQQVDEILQKNAPAKDSKPLGKVTDYGQPNDSLGDSQTRAGKSAIGKLTAESLAVSPDVEQKFSEAGIKIGSRVNLKLADGSTISRVWDDRTADDATARRIGLQPLRGRFDVYHPDGAHPKRDVAVIGFEKPNA